MDIEFFYLHICIAERNRHYSSSMKYTFLSARVLIIEITIERRQRKMIGAKSNRVSIEQIIFEFFTYHVSVSSIL